MTSFDDFNDFDGFDDIDDINVFADIDELKIFEKFNRNHSELRNEIALQSCYSLLCCQMTFI